MDLIELNSLSLDGARTQSLPVPDALLKAIEAAPEQFGLAKGLSRRRALAVLLLRGAKDARFEQRDREREAMYRRIQQNPESQAAAAEAYAEARLDGLF
jgi:hypothetical protein